MSVKPLLVSRNQPQILESLLLWSVFPCEILKRASCMSYRKSPALPLLKRKQGGNHPEEITPVTNPFVFKHPGSDCGHYATLQINSWELKRNLNNVQIYKSCRGRKQHRQDEVAKSLYLYSNWSFHKMKRRERKKMSYGNRRWHISLSNQEEQGSSVVLGHCHKAEVGSSVVFGHCHLFF